MRFKFDFLDVDGVQEIGLIVSIYYKSLEGSISLPIRPNPTSSDAQNRLDIKEKCNKICEMFQSNPFRSTKIKIKINRIFLYCYFLSYHLIYK